MVRGLEKFQEYFSGFIGNYVIIGGTACDIAISESGLKPRVTKDIDIILIVEALSVEFISKFWKFVGAGNYEVKEKGEKDRRYYRFVKPSSNEYPYQVEIFSRNPDLLDLKDGSHLTPIPVSEGITSLSAILLDGEYYRFTIDHSNIVNGLRIANTEALICLKAKAYLDLSKRKSEGEEISDKEARKHKHDILRLLVLLSEEDKFSLPDNLKQDLQNFVDLVKEDLPDSAIFKEMGLGNIDVQELFEHLIKNFNLTHH
ncbi:MAG: hypothetical protein JXK07_12105 [Spirochaetes bacterium]|nr:hypothetical protein [Spirochaetota bacterium]